MAVKASLGKLRVPLPIGKWLREQLAENRIGLAAIELEHADRTAELPLHHRDPFARLLVAQSLCEKLPLVSGDAALDAYGVERIW